MEITNNIWDISLNEREAMFRNRRFRLDDGKFTGNDHTALSRENAKLRFLKIVPIDV